MRLALITRTHLRVFEGRKPLAEFEIQHAPTRREIEAARRDDYSAKPFRPFPSFGTALQQPYTRA